MDNSGRVVFDVAQPERFGRGGVPLRMVVLALFFVPGSLNWLAALIYLPITTAVLVRDKGSERFFEEDANRVRDLLRWIIGIYAYFALLTDSLSLDAPEKGAIRFDVEPAGTPTPRSALGRIATSIPSAIVFAVIGLGALGVWLVANILVLTTGNYPKVLYNYQRGVNRWQAHLLSYHSSLVDTYPPFRLHTGRAV
jgi:hypothetical protein